ncbi:hypothetical protein NL676_038942 [Syzygium grande]|nr:hypothetical protein NL676_038942 [Syzygium grande]
MSRIRCHTLPHKASTHADGRRPRCPQRNHGRAAGVYPLFRQDRPTGPRPPKPDEGLGGVISPNGTLSPLF